MPDFFARKRRLIIKPPFNISETCESGSLNRTGTKTARAYVHCLGCAVNHNPNITHIGLLLCECTAGNLRTGDSDLSAKKQVLLTDLALCHDDTSSISG